MKRREVTAQPAQMDDDALLDSTVELIRAYKDIKDPVKRKELREFARYLAEGKKIQ